MLYKFKSKATGDLIMLEPQGKHILKLIGKDPGEKGIILPREMLNAIDALHEAVAQEELAIQSNKEAQQKEAVQNGEACDESTSSKAEGHRSISLRQRVVPFIDMLRRAHAEDKEVVWGV